MALTTQQLQAQLDALDTAIATGATRVSYPNGSVEYRSSSDMLATRDRIARMLGQKPPARRTVAAFSGGFY